MKSWASTKRQVSESIETIEFEKIASLKAELTSITSELLSKVRWLQTVNYIMRHDLNRFSVSKVVATGEVSERTYLLLWNAGNAYLQFKMATNNVKKTLDIIENTDFSPEILHSDLCGPKFIPKLLQLASEFLEKATKDAIDAVDNVKFSEGKKNGNS